jgi:hypothetical protein
LADAGPDAAPSKQGKSIPEIVNELWELAVAYFKQETIDPLRSAGRFLALGVPGSILLAIGTSLLMLSGLRALQTETGSTFTGHWSWAPYSIVLAGGLVLILLAVLRVSRRKGPNA